MRNLLIIVVLVILSACRSNGYDDSDEILARVYDEYLYASELKNVIPQGTSAKDSLIMAKNYINNWVRQNLVIQQAENNLTDEQKDFEEQLENYRNSLIIYQYETLLIQQQLDTVVSDEEIEAYYEESGNTFELKDNIVKYRYIVFDPDSANIRTVRRLFRSDDPDDYEELEAICEQSAEDYILTDSDWTLFRKLTRIIPIRTLDEETFLRSQGPVEITEDPLVYLVRIIDFKLKGEESPLILERENIKRLILNKRKTDLIKQMEQEIFNNALEINEIEIY